MNRRSMLRGVAGLVAGGALAGCTGATGEVPETAPAPPPGVRVTPTDRDFDDSDGATNGEITVVRENYSDERGPDGNLVVTIDVRNLSDRPQVRLVRAVVTVGNGPDAEELVFDEFVRLRGGAAETVRLETDVAYERWSGNGGYVPQILTRTPATPLPSETATPTQGSTESASSTGSGDGNGSPSSTETGAPDTRSETGSGTESGTGNETGTTGTGQ